MALTTSLHASTAIQRITRHLRLSVSAASAPLARVLHHVRGPQRRASQLAPPHEGLETRFGAKSFTPVLERLLIDGAQVKWDELLPSLPDYSAAIPLLLEQGAITINSNSNQLSIAQVQQALVALAREDGNGSIRRKQDLAVALLQKCHSHDELVFLIRMLAHQKLRIGMGDKSILTALSLACVPEKRQQDDVDVDTKKWTEAVVRAYSQLPDFGALATLLFDLFHQQQHDQTADERLEALTQKLLLAAAPRVGVPVLTMAANPITSVREAITRMRKSGASQVTCEYKYDGARVQLHLSVDVQGSPLVGKVFSRNMEDNTEKYGSLLSVVQRQLVGPSAEAEAPRQLVLEGEVVAIDRTTSSQSNVFLPFQVLQTKTTTDFCLFAFDLLSLDGQNLLEKPLFERREKLKSVLMPLDGHLQFVDHLDITIPPLEEDDQELVTRVRALLDASVAAGCEGLMAKTLDASYRAGVRSYTWMKLKHDYLQQEPPLSLQKQAAEGAETAPSQTNGTFLSDTLDLVPIGAFYGKGRRVGVFGSFLLASYDPQSGNYEAIGKVGTGFSDAQLKEISEQLNTVEELGSSSTTGTSVVPSGFVVAAATAAQKPDVWLQPTHVWEIKATQLTRSPSYPAAQSYLAVTAQEDGEEATEDQLPVVMEKTKKKNGFKGVALRFPRFLRVRTEKLPTQATESHQIAMLFHQQQQQQSTPSDRD